MTSRNTAREWRRALARQNALANEIAAACASGRVPDRRLVAEWSLASMRVFARENRLRPRECGAPLGEGNKPSGTSSPRVSPRLYRDAGRGPESGTSSHQNERNKQT